MSQSPPPCMGLPFAHRSREDEHVNGTDDERVRWKRYGPELAFLLWAVWDPLGGPPNEYQEYALPLWKLLAKDEGAQEIVTKLAQFRTANMGLPPNQQVDEGVATTLQDWWG